MSDERLESAIGVRAWVRFCEEIKAAGVAILGEGFPQAPRDQVDGYRHIGFLAETALRWYLGGNDPDFPRFVHMNDTPEIADNRFAAVRGDAVYRITGSVASLFDVNISIHDGWGFLGRSNVWGDWSRADLNVDAGGRFTLTLAAERQPGPWLPLPPEAAIVQIREYYYDWSVHTPGDFEIVRIGSERETPPRMEADELARRLDEAALWVRGYLSAHKKILETVFPRVPNMVSAPSKHAGGNRNIQYGFGRFRLTPDEALVLSFAEPRARAWSVQWLTVPWYENPDMANRLTSINGHDVRPDADGRIRIVLSARDPGIKNWLDTGGYEEGVFVTRWIWCTDSPTPETALVPMTGLAQHLPAETARVTPEERRAQIARRRTHLALRRR